MENNKNSMLKDITEYFWNQPKSLISARLWKKDNWITWLFWTKYQWASKNWRYETVQETLIPFPIQKQFRDNYQTARHTI